METLENYGGLFSSLYGEKKGLHFQWKSAKKKYRLGKAFGVCWRVYGGNKVIGWDTGGVVTILWIANGHQDGIYSRDICIISRPKLDHCIIHKSLRIGGKKC